MSAKKMILDFIHLAFFLALVSFVILYIIAGDRLSIFSDLMSAMAPMSIFGIFYLIKAKMTREEVEKRKNESNTNVVIYLDTMDLFVSDAVVYATPILMCAISFYNNGTVSGNEIFQAALIFVVLFFWQKRIFSKSRA